MSSWRIEPLDRHHERSPFSCGHSSLDDFLQRLASQHAQRDFTRTYVAVLPPAARILGYYSLSAGAFDLSVLSEAQQKRLPRHPVPVVHVGRLAADRSVQGQGLGAFLLLDALARSERLANDLGVHAVEVQALDDTARAFYLHHGFEILQDDPQHLYLPMKAIRLLRLNAVKSVE
jgi:GNAT superfamily N-acetyltransferase